MNVFPHPGPTGFGILVTNPNGMSVINWARDLVGLSIPDLEVGLAASPPGPGHVFADAAFTPLPHVAATGGFGGTFSGVTLASTKIDIIKALYEAIAIAFSESIETLRRRGVRAEVVRATGGGSKSPWYMQLTADIAGLPVEVVDHDEPGAFGAAILAGVGAGLFASVSAATVDLVRVARRFEPDPARGARYDAVRERVARGQSMRG
jgi:xylulokinase